MLDRKNQEGQEELKMAEGDQISNVNLDEIDNPEGRISVINI